MEPSQDVQDKQNQEKEHQEDIQKEAGPDTQDENTTEKETVETHEQENTESKEQNNTAIPDNFTTLSDEELWDEDSSLDDLNLFDDEQENEEANEPAEDKATENQETASATTESDSSKASDSDITPKDSHKGTTGKDTTQDDLPEHPADEGPEAQQQGNKFKQILSNMRQYLVWGAGFVSTVLLIIGLVSAYRLISSASTKAQKPQTAITLHKNNSSHKLSNNLSAKGSIHKGQYPFSHKKTKNLKGATVLGAAIISLQPFYIPVVYQGTIVFLKLHVQLTTDTTVSKVNITKQLPFVRDIIYEALKGIVIDPSARGNFLLKYCQPLKQDLNKQLKPSKITDVKLMGFILR